MSAGTDILDGIKFVDELPKMQRGRSAGKYDALVEFLSEPENSGRWVELPEEFANVQASTRLNKQYGERGIKAAARRVPGSPDDAKRFKIFIAHNPVDPSEDVADEIEDEDGE